MTGVAALILTALALPVLLARMAGGRAPSPGPELAGLAPLAVLPAAAAVVVAATSSWWLATVLALPAAILVAWQLPPPRLATRVPAGSTGPGDRVTLRVLTLNLWGGRADPVAVLHHVREQHVDVLFVQELKPEPARRLADALAGLLPFSHLDPRPAALGTGLWARWPLRPLLPVPGMVGAAPRALIEPRPGQLVTLTAVHPKAPLNRHQTQWQRELGSIRATVAGTAGPHIVAGDFNASRDHRPFRDILAAGLVDCGDAARHRPWPGFTWPTVWPGFVWRVHPRVLPFMRLDHILVSRDGMTVQEVKVIRVSGTDHAGVVAVIGVDLAVG